MTEVKKRAVKKSENLTLIQKLAEIRKTIGILQKTELGNQGASYIKPEALLLKVHEAMDKYNVFLSCEVQETKNTQIPMPTQKNPGNIGYMSESMLKYTWHNTESDEILSFKWLAVGNHMTDPAMAYGGALTYAERYFLVKFFQIPTTKDDPEYLKETYTTNNKATIDESQQADILAKMQEKGVPTEVILNHYGIKEIDQLTMSQFKECLMKLENT